MRESSLHENRETPRSSSGDAEDRLEKASCRTSSMHGGIPQAAMNMAFGR
jgi:hypothetical protein